MRRPVTTEREITGRPAGIRAPGFVGRDRELATLASALTAGTPVILVEGEAGIGRTRLVLGQAEQVTLGDRDGPQLVHPGVDVAKDRPVKRPQMSQIVPAGQAPPFQVGQPGGGQCGLHLLQLVAAHRPSLSTPNRPSGPA